MIKCDGCEHVGGPDIEIWPEHKYCWKVKKWVDELDRCPTCEKLRSYRNSGHINIEQEK